MGHLVASSEGLDACRDVPRCCHLVPSSDGLDAFKDALSYYLMINEMHIVDGMHM